MKTITYFLAFYVLASLLLIMSSCQDKPTIQKVHTEQFKAVAHLTPNDSTRSYQIFLSNYKNAPESQWIWAKTISAYEATSDTTFYFDFKGFLCNGVLYADPTKTLFGATREVTTSGRKLPIIYDQIKLNKIY